MSETITAVEKVAVSIVGVTEESPVDAIIIGAGPSGEAMGT